MAVVNVGTAMALMLCLRPPRHLLTRDIYTDVAVPQVQTAARRNWVGQIH